MRPSACTRPVKTRKQPLISSPERTMRVVIVTALLSAYGAQLSHARRQPCR